MSHTAYFLPVGGDAEAERLDLFQKIADPLTIRNIEATGVRSGWRCLEVGGGRGRTQRRFWIEAHPGALMPHAAMRRVRCG